MWVQYIVVDKVQLLCVQLLDAGTAHGCWYMSWMWVQLLNVCTSLGCGCIVESGYSLWIEVLLLDAYTVLGCSYSSRMWVQLLEEVMTFEYVYDS